MVTRDVAPNAIVAGNPARTMRWRFDEATREALCASAWWTWPEVEIRQVVPLLCSDDLNAFLAYAEHRKARSNLAARRA